MMARRDIERSREVRLWITKVIVPMAFVVYWCPEVRYFLAHIWAYIVNKIEEVYLNIKAKVRSIIWKLKN